MVKSRVKKDVKIKTTVFSVFLFLSFIFFVITFLSYIYQIRTLRNEELKLQTQLDELKLDEKVLSSEISKLKDPDYIAKYAREKFYYTKDGEYVIRIEDSKDDNLFDSKDNIKVYYLIGFSLIFLAFIIFIIFLKNRFKKQKKALA